jgi:hypothetical protein
MKFLIAQLGWYVKSKAVHNTPMEEQGGEKT